MLSHQDVTTALRQNENDNKDGMEMSLVVMDYQRKMLAYAGAKHPILYVQQGNFHQIKGDRRAIGGEKWNKE
ncbi:hypothetical protein BKI52_23365 [marine bacterium AO1-C]|nr:hypothetical protein BKI52_23365 [marine bacterium AO1-C]